MKKYRLIKKYPGSPELGYISKPHIDVPDNAHYWNHTWFHPRDYPEYWEEVKEPEYEILELIQDFKYLPYNTNIWKLQPDGKYTLVSSLGHGTFTLMQLLVNSNAKIHKVKRLSDNTIFTIGDKVKETITGKCGRWVISEFSLKDNRCFSAGVNINNIEKLKNPLFTTEDGVDIYPEDKYHIVNDYEGSLKYDGKATASKYSKKAMLTKYFSTKEKAEEYIEMNEPKFSKNKVIEIINETLPKRETIPFWNYIDRLKDKIKNIN